VVLPGGVMATLRAVDTWNWPRHSGRTVSTSRSGWSGTETLLRKVPIPVSVAEAKGLPMKPKKSAWSDSRKASLGFRGSPSLAEPKQVNRGFTVAE